MGIEGTYQVMLKSQLGPKNGVFDFEKIKGKLFVTFTVLGHENTLTGRKKAGVFEIDGEILTPLGLRWCKVRVTLCNRRMDGEITIADKIYPLTGLKLDTDLKGEND